MAGFSINFRSVVLLLKGLTLKMGQTNVHRYLPRLLDYILKGQIDPSVVVTHRLPLAKASEAHKTFQEKADHCIKVVLKPQMAQSPQVEAETSSGLEQRLDLSECDRPHSSGRARRQRAEAVPISSALPGRARRNEIWPHDRLRRGAAENPQAGEQGSVAGWLAEAKGGGPIVRLLDETCIRIGNEEYAKTNKSFGLTTLRDRHADIHGESVHLHFRGKSNQEHDITLRDRRLARIVKRCQDLPGQELLQYQAETGESLKVDSADVNEYLRESTQEDFTAKDFRTWHGSGHMAQQLAALGPASSPTQTKRTLFKRSRKLPNIWGTARSISASFN